MKLAYKISFWFNILFSVFALSGMLYTCAVVWGGGKMLMLIALWIIVQATTIKLQLEMYSAEEPLKEIE